MRECEIVDVSHSLAIRIFADASHDNISTSNLVGSGVASFVGEFRHEVVGIKITVIVGNHFAKFHVVGAEFQSDSLIKSVIFTDGACNLVGLFALPSISPTTIHRPEIVSVRAANEYVRTFLYRQHRVVIF